tara:strand:+ start:250 stop:477 length:228 start_codon:yes stop_codon:yes gene_type:complete
MEQKTNNMAFKMKGSPMQRNFDINSTNQGLNKAKAKARTNAADRIFKEDASQKSLMEKGKEIGEANKEINNYTDY